MKKLLPLILSLAVVTSWAQKNVATTEQFTISGLVKQEITITLSDLQKMESKTIPDVPITSHTGELKGTAKNLKGFLLKDVLEKIEFKTESPKIFNEFYLACVGSDGYKVVFSWNEIFNTPTGDNLYLITAKDGKELKDMDDRILILSLTDFKTGRRFLKGLKQILVERAP